MIEAYFREHLDGGVSAPVYNNRAPDGASPPYVVQRVITKVDSEQGTTNARIQLDIFGITYEQVKNVAAEVEVAMRAFDGMHDSFVVLRANEIETYEPDLGLHRVIMDATVRYDERPIFG